MATSALDTMKANGLVKSGKAILFGHQNGTEVIFNEPFEDDNYIVLCELQHQASHWIKAKTAGGFRINIGTAPSVYNNIVSWIAIKA